MTTDNSINWQNLKDKTSAIISDTALNAKKTTLEIINPRKHYLTGLNYKRIGKNLLVLVTLYLILAVVGLKSTYSFEKSNRFFEFIQKIVPYPAAIVGFDIIPVSRIKADVSLVKYFIDYTKTSDRYQGIDIEKNLYDRAIETALITKIASKYKITVSDDQVNKAWSEILAEEEGVGDVNLILKEIHNSSEKHLKLFIRETLLREKVESELPKQRKVSHILITFDKSSQNEKNKAHAKIYQIRNHITTGTKFEDVAKEYSMDVQSRDKGGDIDWVDFAFRLDGQDEPAFREAIFKTKINDVSEAIETHLGFHLVKPTEEKGRVEKSMNQLTEDERRNTKVIRFLNLK